MSLHRHHGDLDGHEVTIEVIHNGGGTLLSMVELCGMDVTPTVALNT